MAKIFITRKIPDRCEEMLKAAGHTVVTREEESIPTQSELIEALQGNGYDAVVSLLTDTVGSEVFDAVPEVKLYANYATGFDNIDIEAARERGITVTNAPTESSKEAVAQFAMAMLFSLATRIPEADAFVRRGEYVGWAPNNFVGQALSGKKLGVVGVGRIGERVVEIAHAMGLEIAYFDTVQNEHIENEYDADRSDTLEELLREADFVSLHVPLLPSTHHLLNRERLALMKPGSLVINTARGPVVDEEALAEAIQKGVIRGAALDVFEHEPHVHEKLLTLSNVIMTPHIASATEEARDEMALVVAENVLDFCNGKEPRNKVN